MAERQPVTPSPLEAVSEQERLVEAIREADVSGQWSKALDLIRTGLVEPLQAENRALAEAAQEAHDAILAYEGDSQLSRTRTNEVAMRLMKAGDRLRAALQFQLSPLPPQEPKR